MHYSRLTGLMAAAVLSFSALNAFAAGGTVTTDALNIRSGASTDSSVIGTAYEGDTLRIKGKEGKFYVINYDGQTAYAVDDYVSIDVIAIGTVTTNSLNIRTDNNTGADIIGKFAEGDEVHIVDEYGDWYEILLRGRLAYVSSEYVSVPNKRSASKTASRSGGVSGRSNADVVAYGEKFLGVPYVSGGSSPAGFDCSGFTSYVYRQFGVSLPRTAASQAGVGVKVSRSEIKAGDLVFFDTYGGISHVGIAVNNNSFIHATVPGDVVKISSLNTSYYSNAFVTARRVMR